MSIRVTKAVVFSAALLFAGTISAAAVDLNVTHFGTGMYGVPYAIAKEKGYFKEIGLDVTGFLTSAGGGTTVRNVLASELPYGEVALPAVIAAVQQGVEMTIVHAGVLSVAGAFAVADDAVDLDPESVRQAWIVPADGNRGAATSDPYRHRARNDRAAARAGVCL